MDYEDDAVLGGSPADVESHDDMDFDEILRRTQISHSHVDLTLPEMNFDPNLPPTNPNSTERLNAAESIHQTQSQAQTNNDNTGTRGSSEEQTLSGLGSPPQSLSAGTSSQGPTPTQRSHESSSPHDSVTVDVENATTTRINSPGAPQHTILDNDSDDDLVIMENHSSPAVKKEVTNNNEKVSGHVSSKYARMEPIVLSDSDMDEPGAPQQTRPQHGAMPNLAASGINLGTRAMLRNPNPKSKRTPAQIAKMLEFQKQLVMQATGKTVTGGANSIFKGLQEAAGQSTAEPPSAISPNAAADANPEKEDEHAWMLKDLSDSDADAAAIFHDLEKKYKSKVKNRTQTFQDEVAFMKAEKAEKARLNRLKKSEAREEEELQKEATAYFQEEAGLFVPERSPESSSNKRPYQATVESDIDEEEAEFLRKQGGTANASRSKRPKPSQPKKKTRAAIPANDLREAMLIGLEAEKAKNHKEAARKTRVSKKKDGNDNPQETTSKKEKLKRGEKPDKDAKGKRKEKARRGPTMTNIGSLLGRDVIADAQNNAGKSAQPTFTETKKAGALKQLIASVPDEFAKIAKTDKTALLKASKRFTGQGSMKADGKGGWLLKGMKTSLYHYQLLGAAFMRDRENGTAKPKGGICADEMGYGKTVMMMANIIDGRPLDTDHCKTTLIVATNPLVSQWMKEFEKHCKEGAIGEIMKYCSGSRLMTNNTVDSLQRSNVVLTTYSEVLRSYPKKEPPEEYVTDEQKEQWWTKYLEEKKGPLHRIFWYRVVLDEAQAIKGRVSRTSIACRALSARHRWAISGTPIQNCVEEFFPYFSFLRMPFTGSFEIFKQNFCVKGSDIATERLHSFLNQVMIRRTNLDSLFGVPLLKLPETEQHTTEVEFNDVERQIYQIVKARFITRINGYSASGVLEKKYRHIFVMLLRLRMLTGHLFLIQDSIEDLLEAEDVEKLMRMTSVEVDETTPKGTLLKQLRAVLTRSKQRTSTSPEDIESEAVVASDIDAEEEVGLGGTFGHFFRFRKYLRALRDSSKWEELQHRSLCHKCGVPPEEPWVTSCMHVYCKECLNNMSYEAAKRNEDRVKCRACGTVFTGSSECSGLEELGFAEKSTPSLTEDSPRKRRQRLNNPEKSLRWIEMSGSLLPSAKTLAIKAQVLNWIATSPKEKIIIFSQFHGMIQILGRICTDEGWDYCQYHGKMTHDARDKAIQTFADEESKIILIASLKCGGIGLNLTMASRVICVDLWWNSSVEQQAFCRIFRIGQERKTHIQRFIVRKSVDTDMRKMQERKIIDIERALGDDGNAKERLSVYDLIKLFGTVETDEDGKPHIKEFIWPEEGDAAEPEDPVVVEVDDDEPVVAGPS